MSKYQFMAEGELESERLKAEAINNVMAELDAMDAEPIKRAMSMPTPVEPAPRIIVIRTRTWEGARRAMEGRSLVQKIVRNPEITVSHLNNDGVLVRTGVSRITMDPTLGRDGTNVVHLQSIEDVVIHEREPLKWQDLEDRLVRGIPVVVQRSPSMGNVVRGFSIDGLFNQNLDIMLGVSFEWSDLERRRIIASPQHEPRMIYR